MVALPNIMVSGVPLFLGLAVEFRIRMRRSGSLCPPFFINCLTSCTIRSADPLEGAFYAEVST